MKKLKICHLADLHLGYRRYNKLTSGGFNQREMDVNHAFREAVDRVLTLKPDLVLVAGDVFHSIRPSNAIITFAFKQFKKISDKLDIPIIILAGNHDTPKRVDSGSLLRLFQEIPNVFIADSKIEKFDFDALSASVTCLPHAVLEQEEPWNVSADDKYKYNILLTHAQIGSQFFSDFGGANLNFKQFVAGEWDYIAMGHIHVYQEVADNIVYPGAIEHTSKNIWGEADYNKGFVEVELPEKKKTFYSLTTPREVVCLSALDLKGLDPEAVMEKLTAKIESISGGIEGKIIKLELLNLNRSTYALLDHKKIKQWKTAALNLMIDIKIPQENSGFDMEITSERRTLEQELRVFCEKREIYQTDRKQVSEAIQLYLKQYELSNEVN